MQDTNLFYYCKAIKEKLMKETTLPVECPDLGGLARETPHERQPDLSEALVPTRKVGSCDRLVTMRPSVSTLRTSKYGALSCYSPRTNASKRSRARSRSRKSTN